MEGLDSRRDGAGVVEAATDGGAPTHDDPHPRPGVAHVAQTYFNLSENWIHTQVENLTRYAPLILTWRLLNLDPAEAPPHHAVLDRPLLEQWVDRGAGKVLGFPASHRLLLGRMNVKVIHAHFGHRGYRTLRLARSARLPLVTTFYGEDISSYPKRDPTWRIRYRELFRAGTLFLLEGSHMRRQLLDLGCPEDKAVVHHLGIDLAEFDFHARSLHADEPLRILVAARFTEKKGIPYAVAAVARLLSTGIRAELTIIGDSSGTEASDVEKQKIMRAIDHGGIGDHVTLLGLCTRQELRRAYASHHVFLAPSVHAQEGSNEGGAPVAIIEAAATGMPVVSTYHCDIPEVVRHGITGLLAAERDSEQLARHLETLARDPERLAVMGEKARQHIAREYDASRQGRRLETHYDRAQETYGRAESSV